MSDQTEIWVDWTGGEVPVQGTIARGCVQFAWETREQAKSERPITIIDHWPWFDDDGQAIVIAYLIVGAAS